MQGLLEMAVELLGEVLVPVRKPVETRHMMENFTPTKDGIAIAFEMLRQRSGGREMVLPLDAVVINSSRART